MNNLALLHRRFLLSGALLGVLALGLGTGFFAWQIVGSVLTLAVAFFWQADKAQWKKIEWLWTILTWSVFLFTIWEITSWASDILELLLLLLPLFIAGEALRPLSQRNDATFHLLVTFALVGAAIYLPGLSFVLFFALYVFTAGAAIIVGHIRSELESVESQKLYLFKSFGLRELVAPSLLVGAVALFLGATSLIAFPRTGWNIELVPNAPGRSAVSAGFSNSVSLDQYGTTISDNPTVVLRVEFPSGAPASVEGVHIKGKSFDLFTNNRWYDTPTTTGIPGRSSDYQHWEGERVYQRYFDVGTGSDVIFGLHPILVTDAVSNIRISRTMDGEYQFRGNDTPIYEIQSVLGRPSAETLRSAPPIADSVAVGSYLQLPSLDPRVRELADSLTSGKETQYDKVVAITNYLRNEFSYTLELPSSRAEAGLDYFILERREGHCEYFSTALAIMLRMVGIPTRNVNGFLGGDWNPSAQYLVVTQNQAHSWTEVWFPEFGWVTFDATPSSDGLDEESAAALNRGALSPVRLWLDQMQHRWTKFILEYDLSRQQELVQTVIQNLERWFASAVMWVTGTGQKVLSVILLILLLPFSYLLYRRWTFAAARRPSRESRMYLKLKKLYSKKLGEEQLVLAPTAEVFLNMLEERNAPYYEKAERFVHRYLRERFRPSEGVNKEATLEELKTTLKELQSLLK